MTSQCASATSCCITFSLWSAVRVRMFLWTARWKSGEGDAHRRKPTLLCCGAVVLWAVGVGSVRSGQVRSQIC